MQLRRCFFSFLYLSFSTAALFGQAREPHYVEQPIDSRPVRFSRSGINPDMREGISYGIRAGLNLAEFTGPGYFNDQSGNTSYSGKKIYLGFVIGLIAEIPLTNQLFFQPEVDFTQAGNKIKNADFTQTLKLGYLNIPLLLKFKPVEGVNVFGGVAADYLLYANNNSQYQLKQTSGSVRSDFKTLGLSMTAGAGYGFTENLGIELRYVRSIFNINKINNRNDFKNSNIQLALRYFY